MRTYESLNLYAVMIYIVHMTMWRLMASIYTPQIPSPANNSTIHHHYPPEDVKPIIHEERYMTIMLIQLSIC